MQIQATKPSNHSSRWFWVVLTLSAVAVSGFSPSTATAQAKKKDEPQFEDVTLPTKDGVRLRCTWYPPLDKENGKTTVPIIILHGWEETRGDYHTMALYLQSLKHAVIVPDLRGHGRSTKMILGNEEIDIDPEKMGRAEIASTILDIEAAKKFLMDRNNAGEVNIELLCVMGSEFGALLALNWAVLDWNAPRLPTYKQGQDVKALVLLTPAQSFKGLTTRSAVAHPIVRGELSVMVIAGEEARSFSDAKRLHRSFERFHTNSEEKDLIMYSPNTSLESAKLLTARNLSVANYIATFINERLVKRADRFLWTDRTSPLAQ